VDIIEGHGRPFNAKDENKEVIIEGLLNLLHKYIVTRMYVLIDIVQ
jgi:hypothetical protein